MFLPRLECSCCATTATFPSDCHSQAARNDIPGMRTRDQLAFARRAHPRERSTMRCPSASLGTGMVQGSSKAGLKMGSRSGTVSL